MFGRNTVRAATNTTFITVIRLINENGILFSGVENLGVFISSKFLDLFFILSDNGKNDFGFNILSVVIEMILAILSMVPTFTIRVSKGEQLILPRISVVNKSIFVSHVNDIFRRNTGGNNVVVSTASIGRVGIVTVTSIALEDDSILFSNDN